jgi:hypothetical protein
MKLEAIIDKFNDEILRTLRINPINPDQNL